MMLRILTDLITPVDPVPPEPVSHFWPIFAIVAGVVVTAAVLTVVLIVLKKKHKKREE